MNESRERLVEGLGQTATERTWLTMPWHRPVAQCADACVPAFGLEEDILSICCELVTALTTYESTIWFVKFVENLLIYR